MYCLAPAGVGVALTEEHLIPRALGGRLTLRDAACEPCRRLTGRLEQLTLDREFAVPRTLLAMKRRRARAPGPKRLPPVLLRGDTAPSTLTAATFPRAFALPAFEPPGLLSDRAASASPRITLLDCRLDLGTPSRATVAAAPSMPDPFAYAHSIAKWAFALTVADRGLDALDLQPMRDLMMGRRHDVFAFVGSSARAATTPCEWLHEVAWRDEAGWLVATLGLFASAGMTPYDVVIGRRR